MQKWGRTAQGKQRYRCTGCQVSGIRRRPDNQVRLWQRRFVSWLTKNTSRAELADRYRVSPRTIARRFQFGWLHQPFSASPQEPHTIRTLVLDGTSVVKHRSMVLLALNPDCSRPVDWVYVTHEHFGTWSAFLATLNVRSVHPQFVVCDGQRGLLAAIHTIWPNAHVQRCVVHIHRQACIWLTRRPKTFAGQELLTIVHLLFTVRTRRQKRRWIKKFRRWLRRHARFLKERSRNPEHPTRWWYTHRKLRAVRSLIKNALPDLFVYVRHPEVPRTSNHVEGGVNSRLQELLHTHRGVLTTKRSILVSWYLSSRQCQKTNTD